MSCSCPVSAYSTSSDLAATGWEQDQESEKLGVEAAAADQS